MNELIEDLRAALDQMNRSLKQINEKSEETNRLLQKLVDKDE